MTKIASDKRLGVVSRYLELTGDAYVARRNAWEQVKAGDIGNAVVCGGLAAQLELRRAVVSIPAYPIVKSYNYHFDINALDRHGDPENPVVTKRHGPLAATALQVLHHARFPIPDVFEQVRTQNFAEARPEV